MSTASPAADVRVPNLHIRPTSAWAFVDWREVWHYRNLVWMLVIRNQQARYRQMALGPLWIILSPIMNMVIFSVIFGTLAKLPSDGVPYPIFTFTALLPWNFFSSASTAAVSALNQNMGLLSKIYFPRLVVYLVAVLNALLDILPSFVVLAGLMVWYGILPTWGVLLLPLYVLMAGLFAMGIGLWISSFAVLFRDIQNVVSVGIPLLMYATPVAYSASLIPEKWQPLYQLNPAYWVVEGFRWAILGKGHAWGPMLPVSAALVLLTFVGGLYVFKRMEKTIVDWR